MTQEQEQKMAERLEVGLREHFKSSSDRRAASVAWAILPVVQALVAEGQASCHWTQNDDGYYDTSCGQAWSFDDGGTPVDHHFKVCPFCAGQMPLPAPPER